MTLSDLEHRNGRYFALFYQFGSFGADYIKVIEDRPIRFSIKCSPNNLIYSNIRLIVIFAEYYRKRMY